MSGDYEPTVVAQIHLPRTIKGMQLAEAVAVVAGQKFRKSGMMVGQVSPKWEENLVLAFGKNFCCPTVKTEQHYSCMAICDFRWPNYQIVHRACSQEEVVRSIEKFRDYLIRTLALEVGASRDEILGLSEVRRRLVHDSVRFVCGRCNRGSPDRVCCECGAPASARLTLW